MIKDEREQRIECSNCGVLLATVPVGGRRPCCTGDAGRMMSTGGDCYVIACSLCSGYAWWAVLGAMPADVAAARSRAVYLAQAAAAGDSERVASLAGD